MPVRKIIDFKVIYICPNHNEKYRARKRHMDALLAKIGFTDVVHYTSGAYSYPDCLVDATIDIFRQYMNEPFLLLEDDVDFTGITEVDVDDTADAIYLGLSRNAGSSTENTYNGPAKWIPWSPTQVRIQNMLATHAILYLSARYKQAVIDLLEKHRAQRYNSDVLISRIQPEFLILANKKPSFYQTIRFNDSRQQYMTHFVIP